MSKAEEYNSSAMDELFGAISEKEQKRTDAKMLLAAKIEDAMKAKGWTRKKLLDETDQRNASVATKWFSGTHNFTVDTLVDIQKALGIQLVDVGVNKIYVPEKVFQAQAETHGYKVGAVHNMKKGGKIIQISVMGNPNIATC